jgi:hypothetical protein
MGPQHNKSNGSAITSPIGASAFDGAESRSFAMRHYTNAELAEIWKLSDDTIRKLFEDEPGVLIIGEKRSGRKRRYVTLRIPEDVAERVHRRLTRV